MNVFSGVFEERYCERSATAHP